MIAAQIKMKILGIGMQFFSGGGGSTASQGLNISGVQQYVTEPFNAGDFTNAFSGKALGGAVGAGRSYLLASVVLNCLFLIGLEQSFQIMRWAALASSSTSMHLERKSRATKAVLISLAA